MARFVCTYRMVLLVSSLVMGITLGLFALIPLEMNRSNGRNLHDWLDSPDPRHTCQVVHYKEGQIFGALVKNCHCTLNCYGELVSCNLLRPLLPLDPSTTDPAFNYGLGNYCCDVGDCDNRGNLYKCDIVVGNISTYTWTWSLTLPDKTTWSEWPETYYCLQDDLPCQRGTAEKHFVGETRACWIQHWNQGQVTLNYPGPLAGTVVTFSILIALSLLLLTVVLIHGLFYCCACKCFESQRTASSISTAVLMENLDPYSCSSGNSRKMESRQEGKERTKSERRAEESEEVDFGSWRYAPSAPFIK